MSRDFKAYPLGTVLPWKRCVVCLQASVSKKFIQVQFLNAVLYTVTAYVVVNTHISSVASPLALAQALATFVTCSRRLAALRSARQQSRSDQACFSLAPLQVSPGPGLLPNLIPAVTRALTAQRVCVRDYLGLAQHAAHVGQLV